MELERQRGRDAEVPAAAVQRPEQVGVLVRAGGDPGAVGGHQLDRDQVVARETVLALEPPRSATEREPGDSGGRHTPAGGRKPVLLGGLVELRPMCSPRRHAPCAPSGSTSISFIGRTSITSPSVVQRHPRDGVPAGSHGDLEVAVAAEAQGGDHVIGGPALRDQRRALVDHRVEHRAGVVVAGIARPEHGSAELAVQPVQSIGSDSAGHLTPPSLRSRITPEPTCASHPAEVPLVTFPLTSTVRRWPNGWASSGSGSWARAWRPTSRAPGSTWSSGTGRPRRRRSGPPTTAPRSPSPRRRSPSAATS